MSRFSKIVLALSGGILLSACQDNDVKECAKTFSDENKQQVAYAYCEKAANKGDAPSQFYFAELLLKAGNQKQAVHFLEQSAGHYAQARTRLGELYENGQLVDDEYRTNARFYYEKACELGEMKGCQKANLLALQQESQEKNQQQTIDKTRQQDEIRLQKERADFEAKKAKEEQRLKEERQKLESQKVNAESFFMNNSQANNAVNSVLDTLKKGGDFEQWVNHCYLNSQNKLGCFHYDQFMTLLLEEIKAATGDPIPAFFGDSRTRNRALRNISEFKNITTAEFNRVVADARKILQGKLTYFWQKFDENNRTSSNSSSSSSTGLIDTRSMKFNEGLAKYEQNGLWGFVDKQGKIVIRPQFRAVGGFYQGRAVVQIANKNWGYIDKSGNWIVSPQFCMAGRFSEGLAGVYIGGYLNNNDDCVGGKWGFITPSGKLAIAAMYDKATGFSKVNGIAKAKVELNGFSGYINGKGEWVK